MKKDNAVEQEIVLSDDAEIVIRPVKKDDEIVCEVCGTKNAAERELCRACSNYLKD